MISWFQSLFFSKWLNVYRYVKAKSIAMKEDPHTIVASAVLYRAFNMLLAEESAFKEFWQKGQTATQGVERLTQFPMDITYQVGLALFTTLLFSKTTVQLMTASVVHATNLTPESDNPAVKTRCN